nr:unnamed protein product [Ipomoea trifida]
MEKKTEGRRSWSSRRRMMRSPFSTPMTKGRSSACARKTNFSLLDRLRDAVLRLIMLSALSKAATATPPPQGRKSNAPQRSNDGRHYRYPYDHHHHEPHRSEALADCIEFMKKSATAADAEICGAAAEDDGSSHM